VRALLALPWFLVFLTIIRLARKRPTLAELAPIPGPRISVIIPARNEAGTIETVVGSVLATAYPDLELVVVDDRSTDGTADQVRRLAAADGRLRLVPGSELPEGWYGKPWACHQGAAVATGALLVFTDADTRHEPELLGRAVAALGQAGADAVTVAPRQRCVSFWERVIMPQVWVLLGLRFHPDRVNHPRHARDVIANGQFLLFRREAYEAIGGHGGVRGEVAEDLALAQRLWRAGRPLHFAFADTLMETRMYTGLGHLIEGWSKNIYLGGRRSYPDEPLLRALVPAMLSAAMLFWLLPPMVGALVLADLVPAVLLLPAGLATGASLAYWSLISVGMRIPPWYGLLYPAGALMTLWIMLRSTLRGAGRVEWKGRTYGATVNR
jgi:chlorobactene glucosyltransferase